MKKSSRADIKEISERYSGCTFLEPREWLDGAILGKCVMTGGLIYDYDYIIDVFMYKDGLTQRQAEEMVEFNMEKSIKRMPDPKPILEHRKNEDEEGVEEDWD